MSFDETCPGGLEGCHCCARADAAVHLARAQERQRLTDLCRKLVETGMFTPAKFTQLANMVIEYGPMEVTYDNDGTIRATQPIRFLPDVEHVNFEIKKFTDGR